MFYINNEAYQCQRKIERFILIVHYCSAFTEVSLQM